MIRIQYDVFVSADNLDYHDVMMMLVIMVVMFMVMLWLLMDKLVVT